MAALIPLGPGRTDGPPNAAEAARADTLVDLETGEMENLGKSKEVLGTLWTVAEPIVSLYTVLSQCLWDRDDAGEHEEFYGMSSFLLSAKRASSVGVLMIGRLHLQESAYLTRRCLELTGFTYRLWKHPHVLHKWLHAGRDAAAYEAYQEAFSSSNLRKDLQELGGGLLATYDRTNKLIHASLYSLALSWERAKIEGGEEVRIHNFDVRRPDQWPDLALDLLNALNSHLAATNALASRVLKGSVARKARTRWKQAHDPAVNAHRREMSAWKGRIEASRMQRRRRMGTGGA